jgi:hypothetical protein
MDEAEYDKMLAVLDLGRFWRKSTKITPSKDKWTAFMAEFMLDFEVTISARQAITGTSKKYVWIKLGRKVTDKEGDFSPLTQDVNIKTWSVSKFERRGRLGQMDNNDLLSRYRFFIHGLDELRKQHEIERVENGNIQTGDGGDNQQTGDGGGTTGRSFIADIDNTPVIDITKYQSLSKISNSQSLNINELYGLLRDLINISQDDSNEFTLEQELPNGTRRKLLIVPKVSTDKTFKKLVPRVLKEFHAGLVSPWHLKKRYKIECDSTLEELRQEEEKIMVRRMISYYFDSEVNTFVDVAIENGADILQDQMSIEYAAAMLSEANVGAGASRVLNRYLTAHFGTRIMPAEKKIYRGMLADDKLSPRMQRKQLPDKKLKFCYLSQVK